MDRKERLIVIGVAMHNNSLDIKRCITSILKQKKIKREIHIVIGNDNSTDDWKEVLNDLIIENKEGISILDLNNSNVVNTRNDINNFIIKNIENTELIGRLDADDEYSDEFVLSSIEKILDKNNPDLILAGNYLRKNNIICNRVNRSTAKLQDIDYLKERVLRMSEGDKSSELPSCNLFIRPNVLLPYPNIESGEDHLLLLNYLTSKKRYNWHFAESLLAVIYNLNGTSTSNNKNSNTYLASRLEMFNKINIA
ncbi:glycosyltransferase family A protein [Lutibacter citreus]|uniref:glycosyltransferase family A protein n=1 Tax=Lutibacter citreus TaxID=2138210 RepID=UPI000DBE5FFA|nr:glycosyltransferase family A protein [Lutibacter citreus]